MQDTGTEPASREPTGSQRLALYGLPVCAPQRANRKPLVQLLARLRLGNDGVARVGASGSTRGAAALLRGRHRAKDRLILTHARTAAGRDTAGPSRFLYEAGLLICG
jgi:hypothetical protein